MLDAWDMVTSVTQAGLARRFGAWVRDIDVPALRGRTAARRIRIVEGGQFLVLLELGATMFTPAAAPPVEVTGCVLALRVKVAQRRLTREMLAQHPLIPENEGADESVELLEIYAALHEARCARDLDPARSQRLPADRERFYAAVDTFLDTVERFALVLTAAPVDGATDPFVPTALRIAGLHDPSDPTRSTLNLVMRTQGKPFADGRPFATSFRPVDEDNHGTFAVPLAPFLERRVVPRVMVDVGRRATATRYGWLRETTLPGTLGDYDEVRIRVEHDRSPSAEGARLLRIEGRVVGPMAPPDSPAWEDVQHLHASGHAGLQKASATLDCRALVGGKFGVFVRADGTFRRTWAFSPARFANLFGATGNAQLLGSPFVLPGNRFLQCLRPRCASMGDEEEALLFDIRYMR